MSFIILRYDIIVFLRFDVTLRHFRLLSLRLLRHYAIIIAAIEHDIFITPMSVCITHYYIITNIFTKQTYADICHGDIFLAADKHFHFFIIFVKHYVDISLSRRNISAIHHYLPIIFVRDYAIYEISSMSATCRLSRVIIIISIDISMRSHWWAVLFDAPFFEDWFRRRWKHWLSLSRHVTFSMMKQRNTFLRWCAIFIFARHYHAAAFPSSRFFLSMSFHFRRWLWLMADAGESFIDWKMPPMPMTSRRRHDADGAVEITMSFRSRRSLRMTFSFRLIIRNISMQHFSKHWLRRWCRKHVKHHDAAFLRLFHTISLHFHFQISLTFSRNRLFSSMTLMLLRWFSLRDIDAVNIISKPIYDLNIDDYAVDISSKHFSLLIIIYFFRCVWLGNILRCSRHWHFEILRRWRRHYASSASRGAHFTQDYIDSATLFQTLMQHFIMPTLFRCAITKWAITFFINIDYITHYALRGAREPHFEIIITFISVRAGKDIFADVSSSFFVKYRKHRWHYCRFHFLITWDFAALRKHFLTGNERLLSLGAVIHWHYDGRLRCFHDETHHTPLRRNIIISLM